MRIFDTQRLHLRPLGGGDEALYCRIYTDPELMRHVGTPLSDDAARRSFRAACRQAAWPTPTPWWVMSERDSRTAIGVLGMVRRDAAAEIGILLLVESQGRGFAAEAITTLVGLAFADPGLALLWLGHAPDNAAMLGLMEKLEFRRDGPTVNDGRVCWQLTRTRWQVVSGKPLGLAFEGVSG